MGISDLIAPVSSLLGIGMQSGLNGQAASQNFAYNKQLMALSQGYAQANMYLQDDINQSSLRSFGANALQGALGGGFSPSALLGQQSAPQTGLGSAPSPSGAQFAQAPDASAFMSAGSNLALNRTQEMLNRSQNTNQEIKNGYEAFMLEGQLRGFNAEAAYKEAVTTQTGLTNYILSQSAEYLVKKNIFDSENTAQLGKLYLAQTQSEEKQREVLIETVEKMKVDIENSKRMTDALEDVYAAQVRLMGSQSSLAYAQSLLAKSQANYYSEMAKSEKYQRENLTPMQIDYLKGQIKMQDEVLRGTKTENDMKEFERNAIAKLGAEGYFKAVKQAQLMYQNSLIHLNNSQIEVNDSQIGLNKANTFKSYTEGGKNIVDGIGNAVNLGGSFLFPLKP